MHSIAFPLHATAPELKSALKTLRYYVSLQTQGRVYAANEQRCTAAGGDVKVPRGGIYK